MSEDIDAGPVGFGAAEALNPSVEREYRKRYDEWTDAHRDKKIDEVVQQLQNLKPKTTNKFTALQLDKLGEIVPSGEAVNAAFKTTNETYAKRIEELEKKIGLSTSATETEILRAEIKRLEGEILRLRAEADAAIAAAKAAAAVAATKPTAGGGGPAPPPPEAVPGMLASIGGALKSLTGYVDKPPAVTVRLTEKMSALRGKLINGPINPAKNNNRIKVGVYSFDSRTQKISTGTGSSKRELTGVEFNDLKAADTRMAFLGRAEEDVNIIVTGTKPTDMFMTFNFDDASFSAHMFVVANKKEDLQRVKNDIFRIANGLENGDDMAAISSLTDLVAKGELYDDMEMRGLISGDNYVGGFYDDDSNTSDHVRLQTALKLFWVTLTSTAGKTMLDETQKGNLDAILRNMEDGVFDRLQKMGLDEKEPIFEYQGALLKRLREHFGKFRAASSKDFGIVGVDGYKGVPKEANEEGEFFTFDFEPGLEDDRRKVINAITSFLMTARDDGSSPYASIAEIAWQFYKIRSHVIDALKKKHDVAEGKTHVPDPNIAKGTIAFSAGEGFDAIVSRMAMKFL